MTRAATALPYRYGTKPEVIVMCALQPLKSLGLAGLSILLAASAVWAARESSIQAGEVGLYFDAAGAVRSKVISSGTPFDVYLVARVPESGIAAYSLVDLKFSGAIAPLLTESRIPAGSAFSKEEWADACSRAVTTSQPSCPNAAGETVALIRYTLQYFGTNAILCLQGFECPTIAGPAPSELYYESCDEPGVMKTLSLEEAPCIRLDGAVADGGEHWGTLKRRFGCDQ